MKSTMLQNLKKSFRQAGKAFHQGGPALFRRQLDNACAEETLKGCFEHLFIAHELFERVQDPENYDPSCLRNVLIRKVQEQFPLHQRLPSEYQPLYQAVEEIFEQYERDLARFWITPHHLKENILLERKKLYATSIESVINTLTNHETAEHPQNVHRAVHNFEGIIAAHTYDFRSPGKFRVHSTGVIEATGATDEEEKDIQKNTNSAEDIVYKAAIENIIHYLQHQPPLETATNEFLNAYDIIKKRLPAYTEKYAGNCAEECEKKKKANGIDQFLQDYDSMHQQRLEDVIPTIKEGEERRYKELLVASQSAMQKNAKDLWQDAAGAYTTFVREYSRVLEETEADIEETVKKCRSILERNLLKESNMEAYAVG